MAPRLLLALRSLQHILVSSHPGAGKTSQARLPFNTIALKSSFHRNSGVGGSVLGCERKMSVVREQKFEVDANKEIKKSSVRVGLGV